MLMLLESRWRIHWYYLYYIYGFSVLIVFQNKKLKKYYSTLVSQHYADFMGNGMEIDARLQECSISHHINYGTFTMFLQK